jgi:CNT family concentrative nucleoside transporter
MLPSLQSAFGILVFIAFAWALSEDRSRTPWWTLLSGIVLQFALAAILLWFPPFKHLFMGLNDALLSLEQATRAGTSFVFGYLGGGSTPFEETGEASSFILAFRALPLILLISALSALLFHWRILPLLVRSLSHLLERAMGIGGALALGAVSNIFVGMVVLPDAMGHILIASLVSAPAAIAIAQLLVPPGKEKATAGDLLPPDRASSNMDAVTKGTLQGVELLINITAMLIVMIALVSLANMMIGLLPFPGEEPLSLQKLLGWLLAPVAWLMGLPWEQATTGGTLLGRAAS